MYKPISVTIQPILSRFDLDSSTNQVALKALPEFKDVDVSEFNELPLYNKRLNKDYHYIMSYGVPSTITKKKNHLKLEYGTKNSARDIIREELFKLSSRLSAKDFIDVRIDVLMFNDTELERRYLPNVRGTKAVTYASIFDEELKRQMASLPMVNNISVNKELELSTSNVFVMLKKKYRDRIKEIYFLETLFAYGRDQKFRDNIRYRAYFDTFVLLYQTTFLDRDLNKIHADTYYELSSVTVLDKYLYPDEKKNADDIYKKRNGLKCIGKLKKLDRFNYEFKVKLREILYLNRSDDLILKCRITPNYFGFNVQDITPSIYTENTSNIVRLKVFNVDKYHIFKVKNIDKTNTSEDPILYLTKERPINKVSLQKFLKTDTIKPNTLLNYLSAPTELMRYNSFLDEEVGQGWLDSLPTGVFQPIQSGISRIQKRYKEIMNEDNFKYIVPMIFETNTPFHFKPRNILSTTETQYRIKLNESYKIFSRSELNRLDLNKKIKDELETLNPKYIVVVNLFMQKSDFLKGDVLPTCREIKINLNRYTIKLMGGNKLKNKKSRKYNRTCSKRQWFIGRTEPNSIIV